MYNLKHLIQNVKNSSKTVNKHFITYLILIIIKNIFGIHPKLSNKFNKIKRYLKMNQGPVLYI